MKNIYIGVNSKRGIVVTSIERKGIETLKDDERYLTPEMVVEVSGADIATMFDYFIQENPEYKFFRKGKNRFYSQFKK